MFPFSLLTVEVLLLKLESSLLQLLLKRFWVFLGTKWAWNDWLKTPHVMMLLVPAPNMFPNPVFFIFLVINGNWAIFDQLTSSHRPIKSNQDKNEHNFQAVVCVLWKWTGNTWLFPANKRENNEIIRMQFKFFNVGPICPFVMLTVNLFCLSGVRLCQSFICIQWWCLRSR